MRKFYNTEIDLIYEKLRPEEEVLWRGKPKLMPDLAFMSTLFLVFLTIVLLFVLRLMKLNAQIRMISFVDDWFIIMLIASALGIIIFLLVYAQRHYKKMSSLFYVITSARLVVFDSKKERIILSKLYPMIKILRLKQTIFNSGSVVFDIDLIEDRIREIGFKNIDQAEEVMDIINNQLHHTRNRE